MNVLKLQTCAREQRCAGRVVFQLDEAAWLTFRMEPSPKNHSSPIAL